MASSTPSRHFAIDGPLKVGVGQLTHGLSPAALIQAAQDWAIHLASSPGKQLSLQTRALTSTLRWIAEQAHGVAAGSPAHAQRLADPRFRDEAWARPPFAQSAAAFLAVQQWWEAATTGVPGVSIHHEQVVSFMARQWLDMMAPSNFWCTNPEVLATTARSGGLNLLEGMRHGVDEAIRALCGLPPAGTEVFRPGETVAVTPGKVILRNALVELIQYEPATPNVHAEPVLLVPSWIMKYYILDLSPANSLVRYLVDAGHTVLMVSWRNPTAEDRGIGFNDYIEQGVMACIQAGRRAVSGHRLHLAGYCLGGTVASIAAATLAAENDDALASLTILAGQTDFSQPGQLGLFIDESQVAFLEELMNEQGVLDGRQMAGAFSLLNSKDLVWSKMVHEVLMGQRWPLDDLHAWNADATRLPARMHSEYLRSLYMENQLALGRYVFRERPVHLEDIAVPIFAVGTERDHVSPWRSVYEIDRLTHTDVTFVLTSGGHNVGIVNPPRSEGGDAAILHRWHRHRVGDRQLAAEEWLQTAVVEHGSWWPTWQAWLAGHSSGTRKSAPAGGRDGAGIAMLGLAPGTYVHT